MKKQDDGSIYAGAFEDLCLPFFAGCRGCGASLASYNAFPSETGFIRGDNASSLRAHAKMGLREVAEFTYAGAAHTVLSYNG